MAAVSVIYHNRSGELTLEQVAAADGGPSNRYILRVNMFANERIDRADGMEMIAAMEAFYKLFDKDKQFAHLFDIKTVYIPSPDLILATINLMRENHVFFQSHLLFSTVVTEHAETLRTYMRGWKPTKPIHYLNAVDDIYTLFN